MPLLLLIFNLNGIEAINDDTDETTPAVHLLPTLQAYMLVIITYTVSLHGRERSMQGNYAVLIECCSATDTSVAGYHLLRRFSRGWHLQWTSEGEQLHDWTRHCGRRRTRLQGHQCLQRRGWVRDLRQGSRSAPLRLLMKRLVAADSKRNL